jgi:hypothetical protein
MNLSTSLTICPATVVITSHDYQPLLWSREQHCVVMRDVHHTRTPYWWGEKHELQLGVCMGLSSLNDCGCCWRWLHSYQNLAFILHFCADIVVCVLTLSAVMFVWQYDRCSRFSCVTLLNHGLMTGVMCSLPEFIWGLHNKSHVRLVAICVITLLLGTPDTKCKG